MKIITGCLGYNYINGRATIMDILFFIALLCLIFYVGYRNIVLLRRYRHNKEYIECYKKMLNDDENSYENICNYVKDEKIPEFKNKGLVLKLYEEMGQDIDYKETLETVSLKDIFYKKDKVSKQQITLNSDVFIWYYLDMARARRLSKFDVLNALYEKLIALKELENRVEYQLGIAIYKALSEQDDAGVGFLSGLLEGLYTSYAYEKNLIGLYKRFASSTLAYSGEPIEEYYKNDLHKFAGTAIGRNYLTELEIIEKYPPLEEPKEEDNQETAEEVIEEASENTAEEIVVTEENKEE